MKKFLASVLAVAMVLSLLIVPAFAAGAEDIMVDINLTEDSLNSKSGLYVDFVVSGSSEVLSATSVIVYDSTVFELLDKTGTAIPTGSDENRGSLITTHKVDGGWSDELSYVHHVELGGNLVAIAFSNGGTSFADLSTATTVDRAFLAYKDGKSAANVTKDALRLATSTEAKSVNEGAAVLVSYKGGNAIYRSNKPTRPDTDGWAANVTFGKDFEFAKDPLPGTASVTISGGAIFDSTLTATPASFPDDAGALSYTWYRGTTAITGANAATYKLVAADVGCKIKVTVSAANYSGSVTATTTSAVDKKAYSGAAATAPAAASGFPTDTAITVTPVSGQEYAIVAKDATAPDDTATWNTTGSFTGLSAITAYDVYTRVAATDTVKASGTAKATITTTKSDPTVTAPTVKTGLVFNNTDQALINAGSSDHGTLSYAIGTDSAAGSEWKTDAAQITGKNADTYYVWYKLTGDSTHKDVEPTKLTVTIDKKNITGATVTPAAKLTYTGAAQTPANTNTVVIDGLTATGAWSEITNVGDISTFTATGNFEGTVTSTELMQAATVTGTPTIDKAAPKFGETLTVSTATMTPATGYTYQWKADGTAISGATAATCKLTAAEMGKVITVEVTCTNTNYTGTPVASAATTAVAKADAPADVKASYSVYHGDTAAKTVAVADFNLPADIANAAITAATANTGDDVLAAPPTATGYQLKSGLTAADASKKATWTVTITSDNYGDITATVEVEVIDMVVTWTAVDALFPATKEVVYGTKVSDMATLPASGSATIGSQTDQAGTFSYVSGDDVPAVSNSVSVTVKFTLTGDAGKTATKTYTVKVTPKSVTVTGITVADKVYDGATTVTTALSGGTVSGAIQGDTVTVDLTGATATAASADVGNSVSVTLAGVVLTGTDAGNYTLSAQPTTTVKITPVTLTTTGAITAANKVYDGSTAATLNTSALSLVGVVGTDEVTLSAAGVTGAFADANVADGKAVTVSGDFTLAGAKAGNYTLTQPTKTGVTANITKADVIAANTAKQNVVKGVGTFADATFTGVGSAAVTGTFTYAVTGGTTVAAGSDKAAVVDALKVLAKGATAKITWTWTPDSGNYNGATGDIDVTVVDVVFTAGDHTATAADLTIKADATYGDAWGVIVTVPDTVKATLDGVGVDGDYFVSIDGGDTDLTDVLPDAGEDTAYSVYFLAADSEVYFVTSGTATIAKKTVTVTAKRVSIYTGGTMPEAPELNTHYTVSALVGEDALTGTAAFQFTDKEGTPVAAADIDTTKTGSYDMTITGLSAPNANYTVTVVPGTFSITTRASGGRTDRGDSGATTETAKTETIRQPDGTTVVVTTTPDGQVSANVTVPASRGNSKVTIPVKDASTATVPVIVKKDGSEEIVKVSAPVQDGVAFLMEGTGSVKLVEHDHHFVDTTGHWGEANVHFVHARDLFRGVDETHFDPNGAMTRGMMATVLFRLDGEKKNDVSASFADVDSGLWYTDAVGWAANCKIVEGYNDTTFAPNDNITREQLAVMVFRYAQSAGYIMSPRDVEALTFADADQVSDWAVQAMTWALSNGIITGRPGNIADPGSNATRAEVATVLERFVEFIVK